MNRTLVFVLALVGTLAASAVGALAECFVDYKAKKDGPLQLHYGIMRLSDAECASPNGSVARRIAVDDWTLLTVMGRLSAAEAQEKKADAGAYFLRY